MFHFLCATQHTCPVVLCVTLTVHTCPVVSKFVSSSVVGYTSGRGRGAGSLQLSHRQLQFSNRGDYGSSKFKILPLNSPNMGDFKSQIWYFLQEKFLPIRNFPDRLNLREQLSGWPLSSIIKFPDFSRHFKRIFTEYRPSQQ